MSIESTYPELKPATGSPRVPPQPPQENELSLLDLLIVLAERRRLILIVTAVCAIGAVVFSFLTTKRYTATALILPPQQNSSLGTAIAAQLGSLSPLAGLATGGGLSLKNPNDMYVGMLKSDTVEDAMVKDFGLQQEYHVSLVSKARKDFEHNATVDGDNKDGMIRVSVEDPDPRRAAAMANGYVDAFRKLSESLAITEASQRRLFFEKQLIQAKDNLANAEEALKQTEQSTGLIQLDSQARALIESAASLRAQIAAKEVQIQAMSTYATGENAQLVEAQQELDSLRTQLAKLGGSETNPDSLIVPKGLVPEAGLEYVRKLRDVKYYETIFDILARQFEIAKLDEAKEGAVIQVVDPAIVPDHRSYPQRSLIVIAATIAGLFLGVVIAFVQAGLAQLKSDPEQGAKLALLKSTLRGKHHPAG